MLVPFRKSNQPFSVVRDDVAQLRIGEGVVADEVDALDLGGVALGDLEHEVHAVLLELDDLRLDGRGIAPLAPIDIEDALHVGLNAGAGEDGARLQLHLVAQRLGVDLAVALEGDLIDDRVLDDRHDDVGAGAIDAHVGEQAGGEQRLDGAVDLGRVVGVAHGELEVGADSLGLDAPVAADGDVPDSARLRYRGGSEQDGIRTHDPR